MSTTQLPVGASGILRNHHGAVVEMYHAETPWQLTDIDAATTADLHALSSADLLEPVGWRDHVRTWRLTEPARQYAADHLTTLATADCGHRGVITLEASTTYTCRVNTCEHTFGPATARRLLGGEEQ